MAFHFPYEIIDPTDLAIIDIDIRDDSAGEPMHNMFKEEICSCCPNFITIPLCSKCSVYTGDKRDTDYSIKGKKDPRWRDKVLSFVMWAEALE